MSATPPPAATAYRFGRCEVQPHERRLLVDGNPVPLGARAFDLLLALVERPGRLVDKGTLMDLVWPGLVVLDNNLAAQMSALRKVLGEEVIATIPGRGYRFVARLDAGGATAAAEPVAPAASVPPSVIAATSPPPLRTNLPTELPALLGRDEDLADVAELIDQHRLVSVVGPGGVGKSLLVQHALAARRSRYAHGVCWVELAAVHDGAGLPGAIASALGVECVGHGGDTVAALVAATASLDLLIALDNAEHLLAEVARMARVLHDSAPGLRLVVTSQAPLRLAAEQVLRVKPLDVPETALSAAQALRHGAVALLAERARARDRRWRIEDNEVPTAIAICRALDGLPLAIELAAARAPLLGLPRLLASLRDRFAVLTRGLDREAPPRQRTLRGALEWSYNLLTPDEQRAFRRLGMIAGSASLGLVLELLEPVSDVERAQDAPSGLELLDSLVDRSLVAVVDGPARDGVREARYHLLETPRAFALACLDEAGERAALERRHALAVASLFEAAYENAFTGRLGTDDWLQSLEPELDNARDALRWAREHGDVGVLLRIGGTALRALPPSLHVERMALADACEASITAAVAPELQLRAWIELSCVLADTQKARGRQAAQRALAIARTLDADRTVADRSDRFVLYHVLARAASAAAQSGDLSDAQSLLAEMSALEDPTWPPHRLLWGAEARQWHARMSGDAGAALEHGRRLLALDRERGSHASIAIGNLIDAELAAGHSGEAAALGAALVASLKGTRHEYGLAFARVNLLAALLAQGDTDNARAVAEAAWSRAPAFDLQHAAAAYLALLAALEGRPRDAVMLAAYSEGLYEAREEAREGNETHAVLRAMSMARAALDATTVDALQAEGRRLRDAEIAAIAFRPTQPGARIVSRAEPVAPDSAA